MLAAALRDLRRAGAGALVGVLLSGLAVLVIGGTLGGLAALARLTAAWRADLRVVAILRGPPAPPEWRAGLVAAARAIPGVGAARYVSADDALAALRRYLGAAGSGLDRLPTNPVPPRLEITPAPALDAVGLRALVDALGRLAGVEEVQAAIGWVGPAERLTRAVRVGGLGLGGLIGVGAVLAVAGATGSARRARAPETAVLRLCGAREGSIWGPLLLQSLLQGVAGAALGLSALWLVSEAGASWAAGWLQASVGLAPLPLPAWPLGGALLSGGAGAGLLGGLAAGRP